MDKAISDYLIEVCEILRDVDGELGAMATNTDAMAFYFPSETDRQSLTLLLSNETSRRILTRLTRHSATAVAFHTLVLHDERKELGATAAKPRIVLNIGGRDFDAPSELHERLGAEMQSLGMVPEEWW